MPRASTPPPSYLTRHASEHANLHGVTLWYPGAQALVLAKEIKALPHFALGVIAYRARDCQNNVSLRE